MYRSNDIMLSMGSDFNYENANTWFKNLDKIIHYANLDGRINVFYSTPTIYTNAKHAANLTWSVKNDDYFPYADHPHAFWTGYFTSRPALKGYVRTQSNYLQVCRQLELAHQTVNSSQTLWEAMGLAQHHDGVSGTSKQHVAYDYARQLSNGSHACSLVISEGLNSALNSSLKFSSCLELNNSICDMTTAGDSVVVVLYNPLARPRNHFVRLPIALGKTAHVFGPSGSPISSSVVPSWQPDSQTLVFSIELPALGHTTAFINFSSTADAILAKPAQSPPTHIENDMYLITVDPVSGLVVSVTLKSTGDVTKFSQSWAWYNSSDGNVASSQNHGQASGAYIFRPNCTENVAAACLPFPVTTSPVNFTITVTDDVQEIHQVFSSWLEQTVRLYKGASSMEVAYSVGSIPINDGLGKEIVSVWTTDIASANTWYTDSNGRDMQKRVLNFRPTWTLNVTDPVSGNFYPVDSAIFLKDAKTQLTVVTDRAQGGASLRNGELELMVHRRTLFDDHRGVGEPINEPGVDWQDKSLVIKGTFRIILSSVSEASQLHKRELSELTFPPVLSFTPLTISMESFVKSYRCATSGMVEPLPENLHLLTMQDNKEYGAAGSMLLRLAHLFEVGEDPVGSAPVTVNLDQLLFAVKVTSCEEMTVTANQKLSDVSRSAWTTNEAPQPSPPSGSGSKLTVTIYPMQIRTWLCSYTV